ncbi:hypothetical protein N183_28205 [Sinorhizobium sp. Sb3]|nr:hypothetical protein N183_28205 [Sinorhizobium sp. Sb3]
MKPVKFFKYADCVSDTALTPHFGTQLRSTRADMRIVHGPDSGYDLINRQAFQVECRRCSAQRVDAMRPEGLVPKKRADNGRFSSTQGRGSCPRSPMVDDCVDMWEQLVVRHA